MEIPIARPDTGDDEWHACRRPLLEGWLTSGPEVRAFEHEFAEAHGVREAIAVTSCTTGLHLALLAAGVGPGDEVIVPAFTWIATANVVVYCGASVVLADVERHTYNIDCADVERRITPRTKAIIPVHLFGLCAAMDELRAVAGQIPLIEDAACAAGATYRGRSAGGLGAVGSFSFHPRKVITTGEGGMVATNDLGMAAVIRQLRNHGAAVAEEDRHSAARPFELPEFNMLGYNYRMTDIQAAVGRVQLRKLENAIVVRQQWADYYRRELAEVEWLTMPVMPEEGTHSWQSFVVFVDPQRSPLSRDGIMERLGARGIQTRPGTHAVHMLRYYRKLLGHNASDYPVARDCAAQTLAIPLHNRITADDCARVVDALRAIG